MTDGISWLHFPAADGGRTLAIFYVQVDDLPPLADFEAASADGPSGRLELYFVASHFRSDLTDQMRRRIEDVVARHSYDETTHYGVATGAAAALIVGSSDPLTRAVFAFSPNFSPLASPHNVAKVWSGSEAKAPAGLLPRSAEREAPVFHALALYEGGPHDPMTDPWRLSSLRASGHVVISEHAAGPVPGRFRMLQEWILRRRFELPPGVRLATDKDTLDAAAAHQALTAVRAKAARPVDARDRADPPSPMAAYLWGRLLFEHRRHAAAWLFFARSSLLADPLPTANRLEIAISAGNAAKSLRYFDVALGYYRHARALRPDHETARNCELALLAALGREANLAPLKAGIPEQMGDPGQPRALTGPFAAPARVDDWRPGDLRREGIAEKLAPTLAAKTATDAPIIRTLLVEGTNWRHFPAAGDHPRTLAIFYAPVNVTPPTLPYYKTKEAIACASLLINPGTDNFFQDCIEATTEVIQRVCEQHGYEETIHFGYSMGATAALRFGTADPLCRAIFALSPHFVMDRPFSRSGDLIEPRLLAPEQAQGPSLLERVENCVDKDVHIFISCLDPQDGVQVRDARTLKRGPARVYYMMENHFLGSVHRPADIIGDWLRDRSFSFPATAPLATEIDQRAAMAAYDAWVAWRGKSEDAVVYDDDLEMARSHTLRYWIAHLLLRQNKPEQALVLCAQCLQGPRWLVLHLYGLLLGTGRCASMLGWPEIALGYFAEARALEPRRKEAWVATAEFLASLHDHDDLDALRSECRNFHADATLFAQLDAIAAGAGGSRTP